MTIRMIHDVSIDADDPPRFIALRDRRLQCPNGMEYSGLRGAEHRRRYPDILPAVFEQAPSLIFPGALAAANALGWAIAAAVEPEGRIEATATTRLMRFKDDVVIRIRAIGATGDATRLDMRSASRVGSSDLGTNARRIRLFIRELNNHLKTNAYKKHHA